MRRSEPVLPGVWRDDNRYPQVTHIEHVARNAGVSGDWPEWTAPTWSNDWPNGDHGSVVPPGSRRRPRTLGP